MSETRKLAAILVADIVGYSRLARADEDRILARLRTLRSDLIDPTIAVHHGRIVKRTGDGSIIEFRSVVDAVRCAIEVQNGLVERNMGVPEDRRIEYRVGIHVGDVVEESDGDLMGDGVNIAARLEAVSEPGGVCLSGAAYEQVRDRLKEPFIDLGEKALKNIARPVRAYAVMWDRRAAKLEPEGGETPAKLSLSEKPSIAVLPFQNMSGDPEQDYFCDGLVEDIITTLSKLAGLRVIARNSSFVYRGQSVDVRVAAKELGVRYVLEGSVRKSGNRIRITAQLIDAKDGTHLWAERYDRAIDDIFVIQDEITLVLATELQVQLTEGEQARLRYTTTHNVEAWTYWVQGLSYFHRGPTKENLVSARLYWEKALALDPGSAALQAMLGLVLCLGARFGWWGDCEAALVDARSYADKALKNDPSNADAHVASGVLFWVLKQYDQAVADARKAIQLAPGSADVADFASHILAQSGYPEEAIPLSRKAIALNPNHPPVYLGSLGQAYRLAGRTDEAIAAFKAYNARSHGFGLIDLVIIYQENGQAEDAKQAANLLLAARPNFTIAAWLKTQLLRDAARLDADVAALRAAGLPTD